MTTAARTPTNTPTHTPTHTPTNTPGRSLAPTIDRATTPDPFPRLRGLALVAAPVLLTAGSALHPTERTDATEALAVVAGASTQWWAAHLLLVVAAACFVPAATALRHHTERYAPGRARLGSLLTAIGAMAVVALIATEATAAWALSRSTDGASAATAMEDVQSAAMLAFGLPVLAFYAGMLALASGLRRVPGTSAAQPVCLAVGTVGLLVGNLLPSAVVCAVAGALLAVGLLPAGLVQAGLRARRDATSAA